MGLGHGSTSSSRPACAPLSADAPQLASACSLSPLSLRPGHDAAAADEDGAMTTRGRGIAVRHLCLVKLALLHPIPLDAACGWRADRRAGPACDGRLPTLCAKAMSRRRRPTAVILTLCLLILQAQVWASETLGCRHALGAMSMAAGCSLHGAGSATSRLHHSSPFDCHRCVLHAAVSAAVPAGSASLIPVRPGPQTLVARVTLHFCEFIPALPERPPRT